MGAPRSRSAMFAGMPPSNEFLTDVPTTLLESFLPGFGVLRRFLLASSGFDITVLVSTCFFIAALATSARYVWKWTSRHWMTWFTSSVSIESKDKLYEQVMHWISKQTVTEDSRALTAKTRGGQWEEIEGWTASMMTESDLFNYSDWDASVPPMYAPSFGSHWFWHNGRYFQFYRVQEKSNRDDDSEEQKETITFICLGRSTEPIKHLIRDCKKQFIDSKRTMTVIRHPGMRGNWLTATRRPSRPMNTVYLDEMVKTKLLDDAKEFLHPLAQRFYANRGIPYRRGYLFHGPPGTGKTSLSLALAGMFGLELYVLSLVEPTMSDQRLASLFSALPARCVVLLEDVDAAGLTRRSTEDKELEKGKGEDATDAAVSEPPRRQVRRPPMPPGYPETASVVTLSGLLNAIDGVASQEGRILVMTTNDPESLDKALIRPGRVDMQVYFGHVSKENARQLFERMYTTDMDFEQPAPLPHENALVKLEVNGTPIPSKKQNLHDMAYAFADALPNFTFTPAEVQGFLLTRRESPQKALEDVGRWRDELLAAKAKGANVIKPASESEDSEISMVNDTNDQE